MKKAGSCRAVLYPPGTMVRCRPDTRWSLWHLTKMTWIGSLELNDVAMVISTGETSGIRTRPEAYVMVLVPRLGVLVWILIESLARA